MAQRRRAWVVAGIVGMLIAAAFLGSSVAGGQAPQANDRARQSVPVAPPTERAVVGRGAATDPQAELVDRRTERSRTYRAPRGALVTKVFAAPVNFRDSEGRFRAIDNELVASDRSGYAFENRAAGYELNLPDSLAEPVRVAKGDTSIVFGLRDAAGRASVRGSTATYSQARDGVTVTYTAGPQSVKEAIVLDSARAPSVYRFDVELSDGLRARKADGGGIEFVDGEGRTRASFVPPFMRDQAAGPQGFSDDVTLDLEQSANGGYVVTLRADQQWLQAPERKFPVVIDPTLKFGGADQDCFIVSGADADTNWCAYDVLDVGWDGQQAARALLDFDLSPYIPKDAEVLNAELGLFLQAALNGNEVPASVHGLTQEWTGGINGATWNTHDGTNAWNTPGGDFAAQAADTTQGLGTSGGYQYWYPTDLVQRWVDGRTPNDGMLVKTPETSEQILRFSSTYGEVSKLPYLAVTYEPRVGDLPRYRFERRQLTGALSANVNVGNGNLLVNEVDRQYAESNSFYALERFYNNLSTITTPTGGGWNLGRGPDVGLLFFYDGSIGFDGPSGYTVAFQKRPDGTYESPPGLNQTLTANADGTYTIADPDTDRRLLFNANGFLTAELLPGGGRVDYAYDGSGRLTSANDNLGRTTTFGYDNKGYLATMTEASGAAHGYGHDKSGNLTSYTAPNGQITRYAYDGIDLVRITDFEGDDTSFTYDTRGRVTAVIDGLASDSSAPRTTYAYSDPTAPCDPNRDLGKTVITQPDGTAVTYCYDHLLRITSQDPPPDVRSLEPIEPEDTPIDPTEGTDYGCVPDPSGEPTYCGENPPDDPDGVGALSQQSFGTLSASTNVSYGIADNNRFLEPESTYKLFDSPAFQALEVRRVRRTTPWNIVLHKDRQLDLYRDLTAWVQRALDDGYKPLLSLERCRGEFPRPNPDGSVAELPCDDVPPTRAEYQAAAEAILQDPVLGQVNEFTAWNEPNYDGFQPTAELVPDIPVEEATFENSDAVKAGRYWYDLWKLCQDAPGFYNCTVAAGDFLDARMGNATKRDSWGYRYYSQYLKGMLNNLPERWAWHAYRDSERTLGYSDSNEWWKAFRAFAYRTSWVGKEERSPYIWLTEQGAVRTIGDQTTAITEDPEKAGERAKLVTHRMTRANDNGLLSTSSRILRFFYYSMKGDENFDSGLLTLDGYARGNYYTYRCRTQEGPTAGCT
jgi:YD repeat-containing protein